MQEHKTQTNQIQQSQIKVQPSQITAQQPKNIEIVEIVEIVENANTTSIVQKIQQPIIVNTTTIVDNQDNTQNKVQTMLNQVHVTQVNGPVINLDDNDGQGNGEEDNDSSWTDATQSISPDDQDDIWVVDDDIILAMDQDSGEQDIQQIQEEDQEGEYQGQDKSSQEKQLKQGEIIEQGQKKNKKKGEIDLKELQQQFIIGRQSNEDWRLGKHSTFCTSVGVSNDGKIIITGGGDDLMLCFRQQQDKQWKQFYSYKHTQTINKIQISYDNKYVLSFTQNQIYCTEISTQQTRKLQIDQPTDMISHKQGGVIAVSNAYTVSIYNIKGLDLFTSYILDVTPHLISFCDKGKQIVAACQNKIRIITPKNGDIIKGNGGDFHKEQISAMVIGNNMVYTGCIQGKVFASNLSKGTIVGEIDSIKNGINLLALTQNNQYLLIAPQGDGLHWIDSSKMKRIFHSPRDISVTDIIQVQSSTLIAVSDLEGNIYIIDRRNPMEIIKQCQAGNTVHKLFSRGSQIYAACEDGYLRIFSIKETQ